MGRAQAQLELSPVLDFEPNPNWSEAQICLLLNLSQRAQWQELNRLRQFPTN